LPSVTYLLPAAPVLWVNIGHTHVGKTSQMWVRISWVTAEASSWLGNCQPYRPVNSPLPLQLFY